MLRRLVVALLLLPAASLLVARDGFAQPPSGWRAVSAEELRLTAADIGDADADAAILFREGFLNDDNNVTGTELQLYIRIKIFNDRGRRFADVSLPYKVELGKISDVSARTIRPDGSVIEVAGRDIFDKLILKNGNSTHRAKVFSMPAVTPGAIIEYRYRHAYPKGFRYFALELQADLFIRELTYQIKPPLVSKSDVRWVTFNVDNPKRFEPVWNGTYDIRAQNIKPYKIEPMMPPELTVKMWGWLYYSDEYETKPEKYWRDYSARRHAAALSETKPTKTISRVVESLTTSRDTPEQRAARLYQYVQSEIHNLGSRDEREEAANNDFKKNDSADETLRRRYGTPREINRLFVALLRATGMDARVVELVTRDENFFRKAFPDALQFNGEATAVVAADGRLSFYDPGTPYCPLGALAWEKQGVIALLYDNLPDNKEARFVETPVTDAEQNREARQLVLRPQANGSVEVQMESKVRGLRALDFRSELKGLTREQQRYRVLAVTKDRLPTANINEASVSVSDALNHLSLGSGFADAPKSATEGTVDDASASYTLSVPQAATLTEKRLLLRPALVARRDEPFLPAANRLNSLYFHYPWSESESGVIEAPADYAIEQLPQAVDLDIGAASYHLSFRRDGAQVCYERKLVVNALIFTASQYANVKAFFDLVHQADRALVSFKQK